MPKIKCPNGATYPARHRWAGKPVYHDPDGHDCPVCMKLKGKEPPKIEPATQPTKPPEEVPKPVSKTGIFRRLGFGGRTTQPEEPLAPPKNQEPEYYVDAKHVKAMANTVYGGLRYFCDRLDDWLESEKAGIPRFTKQHPDLLKLSDIESEGIDMDPRADLWGRFSVGITRMLGARTQTQAHGIIDTIQFVAKFGAFFAFAGEHYIRAYKEGKPYREEKARLKAEEHKKAGGRWTFFGRKPAGTEKPVTERETSPGVSGARPELGTVVS